MLSFQYAQRKVARRACAETLFAHPDDVRTFVPGGEKCKFAAPEKALAQHLDALQRQGRVARRAWLPLPRGYFRLIAMLASWWRLL